MAQITVTEALRTWIQEVQSLTEPDSVHIVDGSKEEEELLLQRLVENKTFMPLNPQKRPHSFLACSNPDDVARVEGKTFICCANEADAGPTNHWHDPATMKTKLEHLFKGCMRGRIMYVVPYCMGPADSPYAQIGVEITDSPYVVINLKIMARINESISKRAGEKPFVKALHSVGVPLSEKQDDCSWPCNTKELVIAHFPEIEEIWSFGSGYGGNALLSKKCFALRIASWMARDNGWFAEHMLIISVTNPKGEKLYMTAAFPSACGKTNLAMLESQLPGWKVECVGDDIAWMFWDEHGTLRAINPEFGCFGVAPGTSSKTNKHGIELLQKNCIFTNVARTKENDVWWEGLTDQPPHGLTTWKQQPYDPKSAEPAAHPNARFTAPLYQCPSLDSAWNDPQGVPISAIIFGGRRSSTIPLIRQAKSWRQAVFFGASMTSATTAAAKGAVGKVRHDPFAMLPFCGYHMGDYFQHWLSMGTQSQQLPSVFYVNWFLKNQEDRFSWPGFGENIRVLAWIFDRIKGRAKATSTPVGYIPDPSSLRLPSHTNYDELFPCDTQAWNDELNDLESYFSTFGERLPHELTEELAMIRTGLSCP